MEKVLTMRWCKAMQFEIVLSSVETKLCEMKALNL